MTDSMMKAQKLQVLSRLFSYPEKPPESGELEELGVHGSMSPAKDLIISDLEALQSEYVRLFINALPETPCPLYASWYLEGTLMGTSAIQLREICHAYGFHTDEMPDHIAVELEFLSILAMLSCGGSIQQDFDLLLDHLRQWTPEFFDRVEKNDQTGFYKRLISIAKWIIFNDMGA